jgi:hypothetical protein
LRVVLCDRVVESVAGWAGIASPADFVRAHLIPWWAYSRIRGAVVDAAYNLVWDHPTFDVNSEQWKTMWEEIVAYEPLAIRQGPEPTMSLRGLVAETQWLLQRLPAGSRPAQCLTELERRTRSGRATASWWNELVKHAERIDGRRSRARNALMHGGPLAPGTVNAVAQFAESLSSEALAACIEGKLLGENLIDYFLDRQTRIADMRSRLAGGEAPADVLFSERD